MGKRKATRSEIIERNRKIVKDYEDGYRLSSCPRNTGFASGPAIVLSMKNNRRSALRKNRTMPIWSIKSWRSIRRIQLSVTLPKSTVFPLGIAVPLLFRPEISNKELSHRRITRRQQKRNDEIFEKYQNGIDAKDLAKAYHYSLPGIYSIIRRVRKQKCKRD